MSLRTPIERVGDKRIYAVAGEYNELSNLGITLDDEDGELNWFIPMEMIGMIDYQAERGL